jgi:hypothetical protein
MQKQVFAAAAMLWFVVGAFGSCAVEQDQMWLSDILEKAEQVVQLPSFGPPRGNLTHATAEASARQLPDDRFVADLFPPTRLVFPDGTQQPEPKGPYETARVVKVVPLTGDQALKAYAKDVPVDPDPVKSAPAIEDTPLVHPQVLFDQRRVRGWPKVTRFWKETAD